MSIEITNNQTSSVEIANAMYQREVLTSSAAVTWARGTLLGRITASEKLTAYTSDATNGSENVVAILSDEVVFAASGDQPEQVIISGQVRKEDLVAHGVGSINAAQADALRSYGIVPVSTNQLSQLDNQ